MPWYYYYLRAGLYPEETRMGPYPTKEAAKKASLEHASFGAIVSAEPIEEAISPASLKAATVARIERIDDLLTILRELRAGEMESLELLEDILEAA